ncbi:MAG: DNA-binding protein [Alphaproteobacteria bacterium]|nr:MAG: DNA-binding protein [Alphaproteobacteria bacterium]
MAEPSPLPDGLDAPYHEGLRAHRLTLPRCGSCGTWQWPPEEICWKCHRFELIWEDVDPKGHIFSWTRVWHAAKPSLADQVPYLVVLVDLPQAGGIRLIGNLLGERTQPVHCGDEVAAAFEDSPGGYTLLQWKR